MHYDRWTMSVPGQIIALLFHCLSSAPGPVESSALIVGIDIKQVDNFRNSNPLTFLSSCGSHPMNICVQSREHYGVVIRRRI